METTKKEVISEKTKFTDVLEGKAPILTVSMDGQQVKVAMFVLNKTHSEEARHDAADLLIKAGLAVAQTISLAMIEMGISPCGHVTCGMDALATMIEEHARNMAKAAGQDLLHMQTKGSA